MFFGKKGSKKGCSFGSSFDLFFGDLHNKKYNSLESFLEDNDNIISGMIRDIEQKEKVKYAGGTLYLTCDESSEFISVHGDCFFIQNTEWIKKSFFKKMPPNVFSLAVYEQIKLSQQLVFEIEKPTCLSNHNPDNDCR